MENFDVVELDVLNQSNVRRSQITLNGGYTVELAT